MARIDFAWELGGRTGHVTTLMPFARALKARGHAVRFLLRELSAGADLEGAAEIPREAAPVWRGPALCPDPLSFSEILHNFGYAAAESLKPLVDAWREKLWDAQAVIANTAPAAHLAARTLGIPSFEVSQGFHNPPAVMPAPPLRHWEPVSRERLVLADERVLGAMNAVLAAYGVRPLDTVGGLLADRAMLLTYPELDVYPERGPAEYYGIPRVGEGSATPAWPAGTGPRVFAYLYNSYQGLPYLARALAALDAPSLIFCRDAPAQVLAASAGTSLAFSPEPMSTTRMLPQCDLVVCHASHQMMAQALLAGKPVLMIPTQLEQFLVMRRITRQGAGLGIAPELADADFGAALRALAGEPRYAKVAQGFAERYRGHDPEAARATMIARWEAAIADR
jgi:UDP:flavonoid glycosyltransferase YjiC (YdhE family)